MALALPAHGFLRWTVASWRLLTDQSEKLIAANLKVTPSTAHTCVRGVLRKIGVSGRNGLIALWLGKPG